MGPHLIPTGPGFAYIALLIDEFARRFVRGTVSSSARTDSVLDALQQVLRGGRPVKCSALIGTPPLIRSRRQKWSYLAFSSEAAVHEKIAFFNCQIIAKLIRA